jgi:Zn-dependent membrane protease YugP
MNSLIKYGLYFVVAFSVLAFGAAEVWAFSVVEFVVFLLVFLWFAGGLTREFLPRGAAIWIPVALFVLLVLFQMVPLPAGVLKVVSPATYELYEEMLPEVGSQKGKSKRQRSEITPVKCAPTS